MRTCSAVRAIDLADPFGAFSSPSTSRSTAWLTESAGWRDAIRSSPARSGSRSCSAAIIIRIRTVSAARPARRLAAAAPGLRAAPRSPLLRAWLAATLACGAVAIFSSSTRSRSLTWGRAPRWASCRLSPRLPAAWRSGPPAAAPRPDRQVGAGSAPGPRRRSSLLAVGRRRCSAGGRALAPGAGAGAAGGRRDRARSLSAGRRRREAHRSGPAGQRRRQSPRPSSPRAGAGLYGRPLGDACSLKPHELRSSAADPRRSPRPARSLRPVLAPGRSDAAAGEDLRPTSPAATETARRRRAPAGQGLPWSVGRRPTPGTPRLPRPAPGRRRVRLEDLREAGKPGHRGDGPANAPTREQVVRLLRSRRRRTDKEEANDAHGHLPGQSKTPNTWLVCQRTQQLAWSDVVDP